jgi:hypothetical protein
LKDEVAKPKHREGDPNPVVTPKAVKTVNERSPHRHKEHYERVTTAKPKPAVNAWRSLPRFSDNLSRSNGVVE